MLSIGKLAKPFAELFEKLKTQPFRSYHSATVRNQESFHVTILCVPRALHTRKQHDTLFWVQSMVLWKINFVFSQSLCKAAVEFSKPFFCDSCISPANVCNYVNYSLHKQLNYHSLIVKWLDELTDVWKRWHTLKWKPYQFQRQNQKLLISRSLLQNGLIQ